MDVSNSGFVALNDQMTVKDKVGGVWKEVAVT